EAGAVVAFLAAEAGPESAAVDPDKDGKREAGGGRRQGLGPDVEVETILGDAGLEWIDVVVWLMLDAVVSELARVAYARPFRRRLWWFPPQVTYWRGGVGDAAEDHHSGGVESFERAGGDRYARRRVGRRCRGAEGW